MVHRSDRADSTRKLAVRCMDIGVDTISIRDTITDTRDLAITPAVPVMVDVRRSGLTLAAVDTGAPTSVPRLAVEDLSMASATGLGRVAARSVTSALVRRPGRHSTVDSISPALNMVVARISGRRLEFPAVIIAPRSDLRKVDLAAVLRHSAHNSMVRRETADGKCTVRNVLDAPRRGLAKGTDGTMTGQVLAPMPDKFDPDNGQT